ncbi:putative 4-coumarate--CoA ligase [Helianthus annuus]|uniref:4-coumarate--CoA ligase n=1 Tax=Helianthus annuus TaxID=4232 RepID=A0A9K3N117_HELAN|nr:putative 4-coumarate--CoA ligase [Helianthus annuus]
MLIRAKSLGDTLVLIERFAFNNMLKAVEKYKVTYMQVSPPLVVAMAKSDVVLKYDMSSLLLIGCGGAPLGKEVAKSFVMRFPHVEIVVMYIFFCRTCVAYVSGLLGFITNRCWYWVNGSDEKQTT